MDQLTTRGKAAPRTFSYATSTRRHKEQCSCINQLCYTSINSSHRITYEAVCAVGVHYRVLGVSRLWFETPAFLHNFLVGIRTHCFKPPACVLVQAMARPDTPITNAKENAGVRKV